MRSPGASRSSRSTRPRLWYFSKPVEDDEPLVQRRGRRRQPAPEDRLENTEGPMSYPAAFALHQVEAPTPGPPDRAWQGPKRLDPDDPATMPVLQAPEGVPCEDATPTSGRRQNRTTFPGRAPAPAVRPPQPPGNTRARPPPTPTNGRRVNPTGASPHWPLPATRE